MKFEELNHQKQFPADFALWKDTEIGIKYDSPFGGGRPGWHTECAALIYKHFGSDGVDFHGGGMDLTFPHHENENIQFYSITKKNLSKKWMRTGQIVLNGTKMSKSLQNVVLPKEFIKKYSADHLKIIFLLSNITSEINIDDNLIKNADTIINKIKKIFFSAKIQNIQSNDFVEKDFNEAMNSLSETNFSNFNLKINQIFKDINKTNSSKSIATILKIFETLEFDLSKFKYEDFIDLHNQWQNEIKNKNYSKADQLRNELTKNGLI